MKRIKLDKIDRSILKDLQVNGRMTNVELAKNAGISAPPCLRRVNALEDAGYIQSYHARLNNHLLGYPVTIFAKVGLTSQKDSDLKDFQKKIAEWTCVRECHLLSGDSDYLLRIVAKDWDEYQHFLTNELACAPHVSSVKTSLSIKCVKDEPGIPLE